MGLLTFHQASVELENWNFCTKSIKIYRTTFLDEIVTLPTHFAVQFLCFILVSWNCMISIFEIRVGANNNCPHTTLNVVHKKTQLWAAISYTLNLTCRYFWASFKTDTSIIWYRLWPCLLCWIYWYSWLLILYVCHLFPSHRLRPVCNIDYNATRNLQAIWIFVS